MGDLIYGLGSYLLSGCLSPDGFLRYLIGVFSGVAIFIAFLTIVQSLSFWLGNTTAILLALSVWIFHRGLKRYESGSGMQVEI